MQSSDTHGKQQQQQQKQQTGQSCFYKQFNGVIKNKHLWIVYVFMWASSSSYTIRSMYAKAIIYIVKLSLGAAVVLLLYLY